MRKLATFAFSFSAAIFLTKYAVHSDWLIPLAAFFAVIGLLALVLKGDIRLRAMLIAFGLATGFAWNMFYLNIFIEPFTYLDGQTTQITAEVADYPQKTTYGVSLYVKVRLENSPITANTLLYADSGDISLAPGDVIKLSAKINLSTFAFGEETDYYTSKGIFLIASKKGDIQVNKAEKLPLEYYPQYFTKELNAKISEIYEKDTMPFMMALITGERTLLNKDTLLTSAMSATGVTHVVAVSGMHISFLVGLIMLLMRKKRVGAFICAPIILVFMAMVGNTPSVVRAGIMQLFILFAPLLNRESDQITNFSASFLFLLFINPYSAGNIGLQLSFASVAGIILFSGGINAYFLRLIDDKLRLKNKILSFIGRFIAASLSSTIGALIFTTPLMAIHFNYVSLVAPLTNVLILWSVSFAFLGGLVSVLLGFLFVPAGKAAAWIVSWLARYIILIVNWLSEFRFAAISMLSVFMRLWLLISYAVLGWLYFFRKRKPRIVIPACGVAVLLCLSIMLSGFQADTAAMTVTAVNVGQGESVVITTKGHTFVVDCGGDNAANVGKNTADYLWSVNRTAIDVLVITHFDSDHLSGITLLMNKNKVKLLAMPYSRSSSEDMENNRDEIISLAEKMGIEILYIMENTRLSSQDAMLSLFPVKGAAGDNDNGVIVLCSAGDYDTLITGDADSTVERRLLKNASLPDIEVLLVGHHGSKYSTCDDFLDAVKPETAIISVGYNSYGHPTQAVLDRLKSRSITVYRTDISGNVTVRSN